MKIQLKYPVFFITLLFSLSFNLIAVAAETETQIEAKPPAETLSSSESSTLSPEEIGNLQNVIEGEIEKNEKKSAEQQKEEDKVGGWSTQKIIGVLIIVGGVSLGLSSMRRMFKYKKESEKEMEKRIKNVQDSEKK